MFYRRKFYIVKNEFVDIFNRHFNETNLPNQIKHGARLVGRWMTPHDDSTTEIFAVWEYDCYEKYEEIEANVRSDSEHLKRINKWYEENGGRDHVYKEYLEEVKNEQLISTLLK
ncbi:cytoplasmic protein [Paenibacillus sp. GCM10027626]|uniref:cytoplasmic protein n=1 Tax=Paenibacillus sp. GCM10027626 TaxID=3273411 RepID=UPI0036349B8F